MSNQDDIPDEPPPSYEEATGSSSNTHHRPSQPPALPPRQPSKPDTNGIPPRYSSSPPPAAATPHHPPRTFAQLLGPPHTVTRQFPPTVNLYRDAFPGAVRRRYFLGEHQAAPLYAVGVWAAGWNPTAQPASLVLHNGASEDHPPLAAVAYDAWGRPTTVTLPPLPGGTPRPAGPVALRVTNNATTFAFRVEVPWPDDGGGGGGPGRAAVTWRREAYEWRRSNSLAVGGLGGSSQGWKLVRLANELPPGGRAVAGGGPPSGDGHEVVAVCTEAVLSITKLWKFCFLGTGVSGALGERWAVMAVVTGLVIWDSRRQ